MLYFHLTSHGANSKNTGSVPFLGGIPVQYLKHESNTNKFNNMYKAYAHIII